MRPGGRRRALRRLLALAGLAALVAVALPSLLTGSSARHRPSPPPASDQSFGDPNNPGVDAIAAAFKGPLRCLRLTFAPSDPSYARASAGRGRACSDYRNLGQSLLHQANREWHLVLEGPHHPCPVPGVPQDVQAELRICLRRG